jgi:hypothetical protein
MDAARLENDGVVSRIPASTYTISKVLSDLGGNNGVHQVAAALHMNGARFRGPGRERQGHRQRPWPEAGRAESDWIVSVVFMVFSSLG